MRIKAVGASITVGELQEMLEYCRDDAEVAFEDYGPVVAVEAGPYSLTLEADEAPIDRDEQALDHAEFVALVASGKAGALKKIIERAKELDY
jgi:hypothetical protein